MRYITLNERHFDVINKAILFYDHLFSDPTAIIDDFVSVAPKDMCNMGAVKNVKEIIQEIAEDRCLKYGDCFKQFSSPMAVENGVLAISDDDLNLLNFVLDKYSRFIMTQWDEVADFFVDCDWNKHNQIESLLTVAREMLIPEMCGFGTCASYGICSDRIADESKIAYEIHGMIRYFLWSQKTEHKYNYTVDSHPPLKVSGEPMVQIR